jgi:hypothetical protein
MLKNVLTNKSNYDKTFEAYNEEWILIEHFKDNLYLAVNEKAFMPAPVCLIKLSEEQLKNAL